jgi:hypothetical protein
MKTFWNILIFVLVLALFALVNLLVHEFGHCITMGAVGGKCEGVYVMPGVKIWPLTAFGDPYPGAWNDFIGIANYAQAAPTAKASGLVAVMGSGSVAALALLSLIGLYLFRPLGWLRFPLLAQSFMFLDLLFYTTLPHWFGLRHFFFIGGDTPEPLNGAVKMGISESTFITGVLVYSTLMLVGCLGYIWKSAKKRT